MSEKPNTTLNERKKHSSSTFTVSVSVPSMSNMTRCMGKRPNARTQRRGAKSPQYGTETQSPLPLQGLGHITDSRSQFAQEPNPLHGTRPKPDWFPTQ